MSLRIAMWSGPRNISTAMMRSWENRKDCTVVDEPFYACYLAETGLDHPMRQEVLASQSNDRATIARQLSAGETGTPIIYQKHMTHHMPEGVDLQWCRDMQHCFLIRDPAQVIASYIQKMPDVSAQAIGIERQARLFDELSQVTGQTPVVVDSSDLRRNPDGLLRSLCDALGIAYDGPSMLSWPTGRRASDGVWADHWYQSVEESTGFGPYREYSVNLDSGQLSLAHSMQPYYQRLYERRLKPLPA